MTTPIGPAALIDLKRIPGEHGTIAVAEKGRHFGFEVNRVFTITGVPAGSRRGGHAHRELTQYLIALAGAIQVTIDDGNHTWSVILNDPGQALLIPPLVWSSQEYVDAGSVLMVLCDQEYRESEYLRDYDAFLAFTASRSKKIRKP